MNWFEQLFGFTEGPWDWTKQQFSLEDEMLTSKANNRVWHIGTFTTPSLGELRAAASTLKTSTLTPSTLTHEVVGDALELHADPANAGATFQVASQFNTLEFPGPSVTPENGITGYAHDMTQGPACAIATAPATVFRNYLVPMDGGTGQRANRQINNLADLDQMLAGGPYWHVMNGYTEAQPQALKTLANVLSKRDREQLKCAIRIGLQSNTDVVFENRYTLLSSPHRVNQVYCSALSCGYSNSPNALWEPLARLVLESSYEATLLAASLAHASGRGSGVVWLTLLGGGAFGNDTQWIADAMSMALKNTAHLGLDIRLAHFRERKAAFDHLAI